MSSGSGPQPLTLVSGRSSKPGDASTGNASTQPRTLRPRNGTRTTEPGRSSLAICAGTE